MKPIHMDFSGSTHPWRRDLRMPATRLALLVGVAALLALGAAWQQVRALEDERLSLESHLARLSAQQAAQAEREQRAARAGGEQQAVLQKAAAQRALPWEAIFRAFEAAPTVRLESWAPDLSSGVVKVQAHADDIGQVQDYLTQLQASPVFQRVSLQRHELPPQDGGVNFSYEALLAAAYRLPERSVP